jgi:hypothetical protein
MVELGMKSEIFGAELLVPITLGFGQKDIATGRPIRMPEVPQGHKVICGFDQGLGERMIVCESLDEMQQLWDAYAKGFALHIHWYHGEDPGFITIITGGQEEQQG